MYELFFKYYDITKEGVIINLKTNRKYKGTIAGNGYLIFNTKINKKKYNWLVHRLIAIKYIPNPNNYPIVNHIDGNKLNISIDNLEWCTYSHNTKEAIIINKQSGKQSKGCINNRGYRVFTCKYKSKHFNYTFHRLLAIKYIPNPNNYPVVNHIDGNKLNNSLDNLEWCTQSHNIKEASRLGLMDYSNNTNVCR